MLRAILFCALLAFVAGVATGQKAAGPWLRVVTGDDFVIDAEKDGLLLLSGGIIAAKFRTSFSKPEPIDQKPDKKCIARIDLIEFKFADRKYRVGESSFVDSAGKSIFDYSPKERVWKSQTSTGSRLFRAASRLAPFGQWKVLSYRYASGEEPSKDDPSEITSLVGKTILIGPDYLRVGNSYCTNVLSDFTSVTDSDLVRYGVSLKDLGIEDQKLTVIRSMCSSSKENKPQTFVFLPSSARGKLLWDGVFFEIECLPTSFSDIIS